MALLKGYVCAADEVWRLQNKKDPDCLLFMKAADEGHYRTRGNTRQGLYAIAPSGQLLASINTNNVGAVARMLEDGLEAWNKLPRAQRYLRPAPTDKIARGADRFPTDGLALKVTVRDLPRPGVAPFKDWRGSAWNVDYAWFNKAEMEQLLPKHVARGVKHSWPQPLIARLMRLHLVDAVRGQTDGYSKEQVEKAELSLVVKGVKRGVAELALSGATRMVAGSRGIEAKLVGSATFDLKRQQFKSFTLVAAGKRWGQTRFNFRNNDTDEAPIGALFALCPDTPQDRVAPAIFWEYGW